MVEGVTAEYFERQTVDDVERAIRNALNRSWNDADLRANAQRFSVTRFAKASRPC